MRTLAGDVSVQLNGVRMKTGGESQISLRTHRSETAQRLLTAVYLLHLCCVL